MEHENTDGLTPNEQLVRALEATSLAEAWRVKWRGYLVFGLVVLWQLLPGPLGQVAICLAVAAALYWILAVGDLMAAHWLGFLAKEHARFKPRDPDVPYIASVMDLLIAPTEKTSQDGS
ncbi:hypothetical protein N800_10220 [Lysobacter daejeonensis GH1-9]|uniref:Transmembrane protein n=1 Tax=Lysobacter daejeonensis GH1-9 TaxID=1385517 RepID=A0A0A0F3L3_9GAMM|nr:hypothetical protein [Lysobacter daejeonensis]KGM55992.1 hypothetical protein N800_10220 [Lysobacter daejeonensis GH1-9]